MKKTAILLMFSLILVLSGCGSKQDKHLGVWVVNLSETGEFIKNSDLWSEMSEEERDMFPEVLKEISEDMEITFTEKEVKTSISRLETSFPYTRDFISDSLYVLMVNAEGQKVKLAIKFPGPGLMNFRSEANDDMDYYIWEKKF